MPHKNGKQQRDLLKKRREYGRNLFKNAIQGRLNFQETIIPQEELNQNFIEIAENVKNGIIVLNKEFSKIEKEYKKFINERTPKIKELENKKKKLLRELNDLISKYNKFQNELNNLYLQIENIERWKEELQMEKQRISKYFQGERFSITQNIENTQRAIEEYEQWKKELEQKQLELETKKKYLNDCQKKYKTLLGCYSKLQQEVLAYKNLKEYFEKQGREDQSFKRLIPIYNDKIEHNNYLLNEIGQRRNKYKKIISENRFVYMHLDEIKNKIKEIDQLIYTNKQYLSMLEEEKTGSLSKISLEYVKKIKECNNKIKELDNELKEKQSNLERLEKMYNRIQQNNNTRYQQLQEQIWKNDKQIEKLKREIDIATTKYSKQKQAYNSVAFHQKQQKELKMV